MNTEITDIEKVKGWVLYDGDCRYCVRLANRFRGPLAYRRFQLVPLQEPWVRERLGLPEAELLAEMRLLEPGGKMAGGADALLEISRQFWWAWPLQVITHVPGMMNLFRAGYGWIANHRNCVEGACRTDAKPEARNPGAERNLKSKIRIFDFLPLLILPSLTLLCRSHVPAWIFMWAMAFALYAGCKWLTYRLAMGRIEEQGWLLKYGYLLAWPGMNAAEFLGQKYRVAKPKQAEWLLAAAKIGFGIILLWSMAPLLFRSHPLLAGWVGMAGVTFVLHFGIFHALSLIWRENSVNAAPVMQNPLRATALADFWGGRWNTAFNELAFRFAFRPMCRWMPLPMATLAVFVLSGLIHELVISLPARSGYGLPTLYFIAQGLGVIFERSRTGQRLELGHGICGWFFTLLVTAGPAFWLFHPPFVTNVILPMLTAIGAI